MRKIIVIGNLGADAEVKSANGTRFVTFRVADTEKWTDEEGKERSDTHWVDCIINNADSKIVPFLKSGTKVYVRGFLRTRLYSSPKLKRMVVGETCVVQDIELCGGISELVPRQVVNMDDGSLIEVQKYYCTNIDTKKWKADQTMTVTDTKGNLYTIVKGGWIAPVPTQVDSSSDSDSNDSQEGR